MIVYWNLEERIYYQIAYLTINLTYNENHHENTILSKSVKSAVIPTVLVQFLGKSAMHCRVRLMPWSAFFAVWKCVPKFT